MLISKNRKAFHNYHVVERITCGIVLQGFEVKAVREGKVTFEGSYAKILAGRLILVNLYIGQYSKQSTHSDALEYDPKRSRELLVRKHELSQIENFLDKKGHAAVPLAVILQHNLIKVELGLVTGLKEYEKKSVAKEKQQKLDLEKEVKEKNFSWQ